MLAASERSSSGDEKYRYLYALTQFKDPLLIDRGLSYSLTPKLRSQDTATFLARFLGQSQARARAWAFIKDHWTELQPKIAIFGGDTTVTSALGSFCDAAARDEIQSFFAQHPLPAASRSLSQTVERINNCITLRTAQTPRVAEFLK
jgi:aminopeptidase N